jgi:hypothetical protein
MRWLILLMSSVLLGACAGSIGLQTKPIGSPPPREPTPTNRVDPTAPVVASVTATPATPIEPTSTPGFCADLPDLGAAPELNNEVWLNTDQPLRLADLRGKVVLIDMWTFG